MTATGGRELAGIGVSPGAVVGPVARFVRAVPEPPPAGPAPVDAEAEGARLAAALDETAADLDRRAEAADGAAAEVLAATALMAGDPGLAAEAAALVAGGSPAARAVWDAFAGYRGVLEAAGGYLGARVADLDDVRDRVVARLLGRPVPGLPDPGHPYVLVARDLAPADTATLRAETVHAIVTAEGGPTSHTAILAAALGIPAVVACPGALDLVEGALVAVDGAAGTVVVEPDESTVESVRAVAAARSARGGVRDGRWADRRRAPGPAARQRRGRGRDGGRAGGRRRGRRAVPHRVPLPRPGLGARPGRAAGGVPGGLRARRRPQGGAADAGRGSGQAAAVPGPRPGAEPGARRARAAHPGAAAGGAGDPAGRGRRRGGRHRRRRLGDGADGVHRRRGGRVRRGGAPARAAGSRDHGGGAGGGADRPGLPVRCGLRVDRHQRPRAVRAGGRPAVGRAGGTDQPVAAGPAATWWR